MEDLVQAQWRQYSIQSCLDGFCTADEKSEAPVNRLECVFTISVLQVSPRLPPPIGVSMFSTDMAVVSGGKGNNTPASLVSTFGPFPPFPGDVGDGSVPRLQTLGTDIDAFGTMIDYRCHYFSNLVVYIDTDAIFWCKN